MQMAQRYLPTLAFALALIALFWPILVEPRLWAEEGTIYFAQLRELDAFSALTFVANANLQLLTNVIVYVATLVPLSAAAHVTTLASLLVALGVAAQINAAAAEHGAPRWIIALGLIAWASIPTNIEVMLTATNVQWLLGISVTVLSVQK